MARQNVPGTVWKSHGSWHWRVKFPDERRRRDVVLTFPFSGKRIPAECPQSVAESAAFRLWDARMARTRPDGTPIFTVNDLCDRWIVHARDYYRRPDGSPSGRAYNQSPFVRDLRAHPQLQAGRAQWRRADAPHRAADGHRCPRVHLRPKGVRERRQSVP